MSDITQKYIYQLEEELTKWKAETFERGNVILELETRARKLEAELAKAGAQLQAIEEVKAGNIRIEDTTSIHLESPTYCAFCGRIFPGDAPDQTEQVKAHLQECPKHPLGIALGKVKTELKEMIQHQCATDRILSNIEQQRDVMKEVLHWMHRHFESELKADAVAIMRAGLDFHPEYPTEDTSVWIAMVVDENAQARCDMLKALTKDAEEKIEPRTLNPENKEEL